VSFSLSRDVEERRLYALGLAELTLEAAAGPASAGESACDIMGFGENGRTGDDLLACRKDPINGVSSRSFAPPETESFGFRVNVTLKPRLISSPGFGFSLSLSLRPSVGGREDCSSSRARWRESPVALSVL